MEKLKITEQLMIDLVNKKGAGIGEIVEKFSDSLNFYGIAFTYLFKDSGVFENEEDFEKCLSSIIMEENPKLVKIFIDDATLKASEIMSDNKEVKAETIQKLIDRNDDFPIGDLSFNALLMFLYTQTGGAYKFISANKERFVFVKKENPDIEIFADIKPDQNDPEDEDFKTIEIKSSNFSTSQEDPKDLEYLVETISLILNISGYVERVVLK